MGARMRFRPALCRPLGPSHFPPRSYRVVLLLTKRSSSTDDVDPRVRSDNRNVIYMSMLIGQLVRDKFLDLNRREHRPHSVIDDQPRLVASFLIPLKFGALLLDEPPDE